MLAVRGQRPFSLDQKVPNLDSYLPPGRTICEIRLLAIEKKFRGARGGQVLQGILALLWQHGVEKGYDLAIISGTTRQTKLYQHLGFVPFGPIVGSGDAQFPDVCDAGNVRGHGARISALVARAFVSSQRGEFHARPGGSAARSAASVRAGAGIAPQRKF